LKRKTTYDTCRLRRVQFLDVSREKKVIDEFFREKDYECWFLEKESYVCL
jgi:hypothetical protein